MKRGLICNRRHEGKEEKGRGKGDEEEGVEQNRFFSPPPPPLSSKIFENGENKKEGKRGMSSTNAFCSLPLPLGLCDKLLSLFMFRDNMVERTSVLYNNNRV